VSTKIYLRTAPPALWTVEPPAQAPEAAVSRMQINDLPRAPKIKSHLTWRKALYVPSEKVHRIVVFAPCKREIFRLAYA
jgi:hypothetical protein